MEPGLYREVPMFPLGSVLLPSALLPLHIFEDRYRQMIEHCVDEGLDFGVALIERGSEVGGGEQRADIGCLAQILESQRFDDGRWYVIGAGTRRLVVHDWLPDDPWPQANIEVLDEDEGDDGDAALLTDAKDALETIRLLQTQLGSESGLLQELADDPALASFQLGVVGPLGAFDRQQLLAESSPTARLGLLKSWFDEHIDVLRAQIDLN